MSPDLDEVKEWLQSAKDDLLSAQILIEHEPPVLEPACFHCQQAVEKAHAGSLGRRRVEEDSRVVQVHIAMLTVYEFDEYGQ